MGKRGLFIVFDGIDGSGKGTQIIKFIDYLAKKDKHNHVILTREPYKDKKIREILRKDSDPKSQAEELADLFIQDRKQHVEDIIIPLLEKGVFVVCDRYKLSTICYQSAQGLDMIELIKKHEGLPIPDLTFVINLPVGSAVKRIKAEEGRNEHKFEASQDFLGAAGENFLKAKEILKDEKIFVIGGDRERDAIAKEIREIFEREFGG